MTNRSHRTRNTHLRVACWQSRMMSRLRQFLLVLPAHVAVVLRSPFVQQALAQLALSSDR